MQTRSSAATARSESWPSVSGKFLCFTFFLCSTITPALAGFEGHGIHGFTMPHDNRTAHSLFYGGLRGGLRPNVYQGPLAVANRELRERQNNVIANPAPKTAESGRERLAIRDPNQPDSVPSFTAAPPELKRNSEITIPVERSRNVNPAVTSEARARIDSKFEQYKNKIAVHSGMAEQHRDRLDRSRAFLVNLLDVGYAPSLVDSWCDDLLDDEVADGMPMDLVDLYWGPPVSTQDFVEYYVPYELCTYETAQGDYRQVTYSNRIVSQPVSDAANFRSP
jgi:hypothetical protein